MSDLSFLLVGGARYRWSRADLGDRDYRLNDVARLSAGIDYGHFSLAFIPVGQINTGVAADGSFDEDSVAVSRFQLSARYAEWAASFTTGGGNGGRSKMTISRANFTYQISTESNVRLSWITRASESTPATIQSVFYQAKSNTLAAWYERILMRRVPVGLSFAYEMYEFDGRGATAVVNSKRSEGFFKAGIMFGLIF